MKKFLVVFLSVLVVFQGIVMSGAALYDSDERYTIDLPEKFRQAGDNKFRADDSSEFSVTFSDNKEEQLSIRDMGDKAVKEYVDTMETEGNKLLKETGVDGSLKILSAEKIKHSNGQYALVMTVETRYAVEGKTTVKYQKLYGFSCVDNKITFTYTAANKDDLNSVDNAFNSIVINEQEAESNVDKITTAAFYIGIVAVTILVVIVFVKRRSK